MPIDQITRLEFSSVPPIIERFNRERSDLVKSQVRAGYHVGKVTAAVGEEIAKLNWPAGLRWAFTGEVESQEESFGGTGEILLIAAFGIFAILVLESGSFRATLLVASVVPLGLIGGVTALWITGNSLSFTGAIGFIAGAIMYVVAQSLGLGKHLYYTAANSAMYCSKPKEQNFKCYVYKNGNIISSL